MTTSLQYSDVEQAAARIEGLEEAQPAADLPERRADRAPAGAAGADAARLAADPTGAADRAGDEPEWPPLE